MNGALLRLLDANANRAREALRVLEDYARFVLDDQTLCGDLKSIRHDLTAALRAHLPEAILHRDTPGDVGTATKTDAESQRQDLSSVVTAAGKRLGEALRSIEEYLKVISAGDAARVESIRYRFYEIERRLALTLHPANRFAEVRLYVLITESACPRPWLEAAEQAILGGADCLQLREKTLEAGELLRRAKALVDLCRRHGVLCIINDRPDVAILSGADGVHVGQGDLPAAEVRKIVGSRLIVGVSTHDVAQAKQAVLDGADYIGVGPFFRSETKPRDFVAGPDYAKAVAKSIPIPAVAIAGITEDNVDQVLATGVKAIAVTAAVLGCKDIREAAERLKQKLMGQTFLSASSKAGTGGEMVGQTFLPVISSSEPIGSDLSIKRRKLPHWHLGGSTYYITFRIKNGELDAQDRRIVLEHVLSGNKRFYQLIAMVIMPDHAHLLLNPLEGMDLSRIMKGIKGVSAKRINERRGSSGSVWQDESWDRIMRDQQELDEKLRYMLNNPVKNGLAADGWDYDGWYVNEEWTGFEGAADKNVCPTKD